MKSEFRKSKAVRILEPESRRALGVPKGVLSMNLVAADVSRRMPMASKVSAD